jgi:hypothetical protein
VCNYDCTLPVALRQKDGTTVAVGQLVTPTVSSSDLPGLLGLSALKRNRAILDFNTMELHFCGPGDYDLAKAIPPGTDTFQLEVAPSGHLVLPCCEFSTTTGSPPSMEEHTLTLISRTSRPRGKSIPPVPQQPPRLMALPRVEPLMPPPGFEAH